MSTSLICTCLLLRLLANSSLLDPPDERALPFAPSLGSLTPPTGPSVIKPDPLPTPVSPAKPKTPRKRPAAPPQWHATRDALPPVLASGHGELPIDSERTGVLREQALPEQTAEVDGDDDTLSEMSHSRSASTQTSPGASGKQASPSLSRKKSRTPSVSSRRSSISSARTSASGIFPPASAALAPIISDHEHVPHQLLPSGGEDETPTESPARERQPDFDRPLYKTAVPSGKPRLYAMPKRPGPNPRHTASATTVSSGTAQQAHASGNNAVEKLRSVSGAIR
ncbi:hypothetical protein B0A53_05700 [Rhodotorula sp. CCFEE 5036]|nr:hypothetical protein B0A53_05700 [Rhodotorula sp. CCFEE 5036]